MSNLSSDGVSGARGGDARAAVDGRAPLILCIDSATDAPSVAVARGKSIVAKSGGGGRRGQSLLLLPGIDAVLRAANVSLAGIDLFAVAVGPGSFTGLRTALATVKAFASAPMRPVAAIPTLHAVAASAGASAQTVAAIAAGRGEVFAQTLSVDGEGRVEELTQPRHVSPATLVRQALASDGPLRWAGGGVLAHVALMREAAQSAGIAFDERGARAPSCTESGGRLWEIATGAEDYAAEITALSLIRFKAGETVSAGELRALYVRPSDAELKEKCRR
jgi:tRNA threonylcarbamoyladenosine biosynthesis protein TsaB